ncbi:glycosyltransferase WbuB [Oceanobacillus arenosus]|uniref:Glycosyltransferase WbuB n=1 Tax=Oceanobacillus arenosus TaxID=1229153 RepID=A0A3D8Q1X7_9BACI|nr:glycosyltransferase family 4 protein [Oceanobacillus arenosus]RDW22223.1 glycosyltransferase WbuB [Oceanobacillus arenosus]
MKKKVLIMTQNFYPVIGSAGNRMKNIYQLLNDSDIDADVLTTEPAYPNKNLYNDKTFWDDEALNKETKKIIRVPIKNKKFSNHIVSRLYFYIEIMWRFLIKLWQLRKENYDYIMVSSPPIFIVFSALIGKLFLKSKLILEVRDLWPDSLVGVKTFDNRFILKIFRMLEKRMYGAANQIVINSKGFESHIRSKLKKDIPIIYLPNGPRDHEIVRSKTYEGEFRVVYTGNLGLAQDIDHLKLIASALQKEGIRFDVIGYGIKTDEFTSYIDKHQLKNVYMHHPTTRKKSLELIENSNIAVAFLNDVDVFSTVLPGKIIDYMTCGTPIIAGIKGTAAQIITKSGAGFAFEQQDIQGMIEKIVKLKDNPKELERIGENCTKAVQDAFLWENNINELVQIINE